MDDVIGIDFETYSDVDLKKHGLDRYIASPNFRPLIVAINYHTTITRSGRDEIVIDFTKDFDLAMARLATEIQDKYLVAHNAGFERAVLKRMGLDLPLGWFIDSAVVARAAGAAGKLAHAAPQLLNSAKMDEGVALIKLFSIPGKYQEENGNGAFDPRIVAANPKEWHTFKQYCKVDARLGFEIYEKAGDYFFLHKEHRYQEVTMAMNETGWPVDLDAVREMNTRFIENLETEIQEFHDRLALKDFNFNSLKQMKDFCHERGIKATSFDEKHVASMKEAILSRMTTMPAGTKRDDYQDVVDMLNVKQQLGGSSLKKLPVILDTVGADGRLRDQYVHVGAGQSYRTSGRSAQLQNLKRLDAENLLDMRILFDEVDTLIDNNVLAQNVRQVFTSSQADGELLVGDFASVESRGLAWLSGEEYKLKAYREGKDLYKVLASAMFSTPYDDIIKSQRQVGKVGELSCGYGAGGGAVQKFANNMGVVMSEYEAADLVRNWRIANPNITAFWAKLDKMLADVVSGDSLSSAMDLADGFRLVLATSAAPESLRKQTQLDYLKSLIIEVIAPNGSPFLRRIFHGVYLKGRNIQYFKPSELKSGDPWKAFYMEPKTKKRIFYNLYGGKLAGILTQSFCRELFFQALRNVYDLLKTVPNVELIGQFHDEIVLDWWPSDEEYAWSRTEAVLRLKTLMSDPRQATTFPLEAEVNFDYRYIK